MHLVRLGCGGELPDDGGGAGFPSHRQPPSQPPFPSPLHSPRAPPSRRDLPLLRDLRPPTRRGFFFWLVGRQVVSGSRTRCPTSSTESPAEPGWAARCCCCRSGRPHPRHRRPRPTARPRTAMTSSSMRCPGWKRSPASPSSTASSLILHGVLRRQGILVGKLGCGLRAFVLRHLRIPSDMVDAITL